MITEGIVSCSQGLGLLDRVDLGDLASAPNGSPHRH